MSDLEEFNKFLHNHRVLVDLLIKYRKMQARKQFNSYNTSYYSNTFTSIKFYKFDKWTTVI